MSDFREMKSTDLQLVEGKIDWRSLQNRMSRDCQKKRTGTLKNEVRTHRIRSLFLNSLWDKCIEPKTQSEDTDDII